jgi:hypothetical protein
MAMEVSISPTFFEQLFLYESQTNSLSVLKFSLKKIGAKAAHKMLVKFTTRETNVK